MRFVSGTTLMVRAFAYSGPEATNGADVCTRVQASRTADGADNLNPTPCLSRSINSLIPSNPGGHLRFGPSYTQKLWLRLMKKAAYLAGC